MKKKEVTIKETDRSVVRLHGKPNIEAWSKKIKQVLDDLEAGRYKDDKET